MMEPPLYKLELTYTKEDYARYFKFYKWVLKRIQLRLAFYFLLFVVVGIAVSYYLDNWLYFGFFILFGCAVDAFNVWYQNRIDRNVMESELKAMPVVYRFYQDYMTASNAAGNEFTVRYSQIYAVCEYDSAIYIMVERDTAAIIPGNCPKDLRNFILNLVSVYGRTTGGGTSKVRQ